MFSNARILERMLGYMPGIGNGDDLGRYHWTDKDLKSLKSGARQGRHEKGGPTGKRA